MTDVPSKVFPCVFPSTFGCGGFVFLHFSVFPAQCWRLGRLSALPQPHGRGRLCGKWFVGGGKASPLARNLGLGELDAGCRPRASKAWAARTRMGLEFPDAGVGPRVDKAWAVRARLGMGLPDAGLRPGVRKAWPQGRGWAWNCPTQALRHASAKRGPPGRGSGGGFPDAGRAWDAGTRLGLELPDACLWPGGGKARATRKNQRREWRSRA